MRAGAARGHVGHFHEAGFYASDAEFLDLIVPFVTEGVAADEPVIIGYDDRKTALLRAALPSPDAVTFIADRSLYASPAGAIEAYRREFDRHLAAGARQIRIAGDVPHEGNGGRFAAGGWDRYESGVNTAWGDRPVWSRCLYDATTVPATVRDVVERTHRRLVTPDGATASPRYQDVADFQPLPSPVDPLESTPPTLVLADPSPRRTRHRIAAVADGLIGSDALEQLVLAVSEAVENAHRHGRPPATVTAWAAPGRVVVHVHDTGPGPANPLAGLVREESSAGGRGLWLSHQLPDVEIALTAAATGFTVRLRGVA
ncbi:anti-sigma factor RsbA family regulatory protein [Geodermatophilus sp. SYSU D00758]